MTLILNTYFNNGTFLTKFDLLGLNMRKNGNTGNNRSEMRILVNGKAIRRTK